MQKWCSVQKSLRNVAVQKRHCKNVKSWKSILVQKYRREILSLCKNIAVKMTLCAKVYSRAKVTPCKCIPLCNRVAVQNCPLVQKWRHSKVSPRAKVTRSRFLYKLNIFWDTVHFRFYQFCSLIMVFLLSQKKF